MHRALGAHGGGASKAGWEASESFSLQCLLEPDFQAQVKEQKACGMGWGVGAKEVLPGGRKSMWCGKA